MASRGVVAGDETVVEMTQLVLPGETNSRGTLFGGQLAAWMDIAGAVSAMRFARGPVVTASMDELHFLRPIQEGMIVVLKARVNEAWRSSMEVGVRVEAEVPDTGERFHCTSGYLTFVAVDEAGRPRRVPRLDPEGDARALRRAAEARARRDHRLRVAAARRAAER